MSSSNPFTPNGNTVVFTAAASPPTAVQAVGTCLGPTQYLIQNTGLVTAFLGVGGSASAAASNAAVITSTGPSIPLLPSTVQVLTFAPQSYFTGVASSGCVVYVTPGEGT